MHPHLSQALVQSHHQDLMRQAADARLAGECGESQSTGRLHRLMTGTWLRGRVAVADTAIVGQGRAAIAR